MADNNRLMRIPVLLLVLVLAISVSACSTRRDKLNFIRLDPEIIAVPVSTTARLSSQERQEILDTANRRNMTEEKDPQWIKSSYSGLMVRRLNSVSSKSYADYAQYLENDAAYIVIHPAFFPFFHGLNRLTPVIEDIENASDLPRTNVVEKFLALKPSTEEMVMLQAQERRMRDFIEFKSTQKKLMIIVVPRRYAKYNGYVYKEGPDEYMRYLNEITNMSPSVVFIESRSPNRGYPTEEDGLLLMDFLAAIRAKNLYIAGGYVGRCLEDFYVSLTETYGNEGIFIIPELADISPQELNNAMAYEILDEAGSIDMEAARYFIKEDVFDVQQVHPNLKSLP